MLRFYAKEDLLVREMRGALVGNPAPYVGRTFDASRRAYPALESAYEVAADSDEGRRLVKLVRRDRALWPADERTAAACGVEFTPVTFESGSWVADSE